MCVFVTCAAYFAFRDNDHLVVTTPEDDVEREETIASSRSSTVRLNVGGVSFTTCRSSLSLRAPTCMLARMIAAEDQGMAPGEKDNTGAVMIDRSPEYFRPLLNYLRTGKLILDRAVNPEGTDINLPSTYNVNCASVSQVLAIVNRRP